MTTEHKAKFRNTLIGLAYSYARLVILSFGFQHAFQRGAIKKENAFLFRVG